MLRHRTIALAAAFCGIATAPGPAAAHPHVFAEATLQVSLDGAGGVASLGHVWRFDDLFSSTVLLEFDKNQDLKLDDAELKEVAATVHASLAEFDYFQFVTADGKDVTMAPPKQMVALFEDNVLTIMFESNPAQALALKGKVAFGVYDPTFYTAIDFSEDGMMMVEGGLPAGCARTVVRPDPDEALTQNQESLTDAFFNDPTGVDYSKLFATRLEITCQGAG